MKTIMGICALGFFATATIGLLLLAVGFLSEWDWAFRMALACGALCVLCLLWCGILSELV